jgi:hypothetical protein
MEEILAAVAVGAGLLLLISLALVASNAHWRRTVRRAADTKPRARESAMPRPNDAEMMDVLTDLFVQPVHADLGNAYLLSSDKVVLSIRMIESDKHKKLRPGYNCARNHSHDVLVVDKDMLIERLRHMLEQLEEEVQQRQAQRMRAIARITAPAP